MEQTTIHTPVGQRRRAMKTVDYTTVRDSGLHGKGLFTTRPVEKGRFVLFMESPVHSIEVQGSQSILDVVGAAVVLLGNEIAHAAISTGLPPRKRDKAVNATAVFREFYPRSLEEVDAEHEREKLFGDEGAMGLLLSSLATGGDPTGIGRAWGLIESKGRRDDLLLLYVKLYRNSFASTSGGSVSWYAKGTFANHSCRPTALMASVNGLMCLRALVDLAKGDEVTFSYTDPSQRPYHRHILMQQYGIDCGCMPFSGYVCWACKMPFGTDSVLCDGCGYARYCSRGCLRIARNTVHDDRACEVAGCIASRLRNQRLVADVDEGQREKKGPPS
jgi:hypothetical protein